MNDSELNVTLINIFFVSSIEDYLNSSGEEEDMHNNTIVQDHRQLSDWSEAGNETKDKDLPIDMTFNDGHMLSIIVYRWVKSLLSFFSSQLHFPFLPCCTVF